MLARPWLELILPPTLWTLFSAWSSHEELIASWDYSICIIARHRTIDPVLASFLFSALPISATSMVDREPYRDGSSPGNKALLSRASCCHPATATARVSSASGSLEKFRLP
ncbi:hypothetical protein BC834DRAFT_110202 [Gloeopeniophorella convolvens]|nr:hypothetical protein BC834DRAFT_110202 [Gloeopeniophorella convolvens]